MTTTETPAAAGTPAEPRHGLRLFLIWIILALAADLIIWFVWYPHLPPGRMSNSAMHQQFDIAVLAISAAPVIIAVLLYFIYAIVVWRAKPGDDSDGAPIYGNIKVQATWIVGTTMIVLWLFVFGTVELVVPARRGCRRGSVADLDAGRDADDVWTPGDERDPAGPGDRPAVDLDVPVPAVRRDGKQRADAAGEYPGDVPRDLAGRDPQLLGLPARREGRRQPAGGQRGVHDAEVARQRHRPLQRAVRHLARRHVQLRPAS